MNKKSSSSQTFEAVVGVFRSRESAASAVRAIDRMGLDFSEIDSLPVSQDNENAAELQQLFFASSDEVGSNDVVAGIAKGAAIGAAAGSLFLAVPTFGLAAPIGGLLGGALVGGMAGIDESMRESKLPDLNDYRQMIANGKTLLIIEGPESFRVQVAKDLIMLGAESVHQHPPCPASIVASNKPEGDGNSST